MEGKPTFRGYVSILSFGSLTEHKAEAESESAQVKHLQRFIEESATGHLLILACERNQEFQAEVS